MKVVNYSNGMNYSKEIYETKMEIEKSDGYWKFLDVSEPYFNIFVYVIAYNGFTWSSPDISPALKINLVPPDVCVIHELSLIEFTHKSTSEADSTAPYTYTFNIIKPNSLQINFEADVI